MSERQKVFVLTWRYTDGSGYSVLRAYSSLARAQEDAHLAEEIGDSMKEFRISGVEHLTEEVT